eukprot:SAG31_NODE_4153_length_3524_cov_2.923862_3_plen_69_part_00
MCTQLFWSLRIGAWGWPEAAGVAAAARRVTRGSGGVGAVNVFELRAPRGGRAARPSGAVDRKLNLPAC